MKEKILINKLNHNDLNMYQCGIEVCSSAHSYGPAVRDHYLIHYVLEGKGVFQTGQKTYQLEKNQGFLICPHTVTYYQADPVQPWKYAWVGFNGLKAGLYLQYANLTAHSPVFRYDRDRHIEECLMEMVAAAKSKSRDIKLPGLLYLFLAHLVETYHAGRSLYDYEDRHELYIRKAVEYIEMNYSRKISIQEIARHLLLNRSYFCSVFKKHLGIAPQEFLLEYRMNKACELMRNHVLSIGDIARSVGYEDPLLFSKVFKKVKGLSPTDYRRNMISL